MREDSYQEDRVGRSTVRQADLAGRRQTFTWPVAAGVAVVLAFAVVGVVSAGSFAADKLSGSSKSATSTPPARRGPSVAVQDVTRAQAQATAIVNNAQAAGHGIVATATTRANRQAGAIVAAARRQAAAIAAKSPASSSGSSGTAASAAPPVSPTAPAVVAPYTGTSAQSTFQGGTTPSTTYQGVTTVPTTPAYSTTTGSGAATSPSLAGLPASWKVVGYNATFGAGPGSAGSITVTNRSGKKFSGMARVVYAHGGSAVASFSGLAPGQTLVLPLDGAAYRGGGYRIEVNPY
ncbi:MAG: hypothetical protein JOZ41_11700 [Chloroflexi bacterium]|nr:hypothetical protein [Chloroflexota bacterium]